MLTAALISLGVVFVAELGDKSQLMSMTYALRHRWWVVLSGVAVAAFLVHGLAVTVGHFLGLTLPERPIAFAAAISFFVFAAWTWRERRDRGPTPAAPEHRFVLLAVVSSYVLAELGDKTMLATVALASDRPSACCTGWPVCYSSSSGCGCCSTPHWAGPGWPSSPRHPRPSWRRPPRSLRAAAAGAQCSSPRLLQQMSRQDCVGACRLLAETNTFSARVTRPRVPPVFRCRSESCLSAWCAVALRAADLSAWAAPLPAIFYTRFYTRDNLSRFALGCGQKTRYDSQQINPVYVPLPTSEVIQ